MNCFVLWRCSRCGWEGFEDCFECKSCKYCHGHLHVVVFSVGDLVVLNEGLENKEEVV